MAVSICMEMLALEARLLAPVSELRGGVMLVNQLLAAQALISELLSESNLVIRYGISNCRRNRALVFAWKRKR